jgi:hypothetical protein
VATLPHTITKKHPITSLQYHLQPTLSHPPTSTPTSRNNMSIFQPTSLHHGNTLFHSKSFRSMHPFPFPPIPSPPIYLPSPPPPLKFPLPPLPPLLLPSSAHHVILISSRRHLRPPNMSGACCRASRIIDLFTGSKSGLLGCQVPATGGDTF